MGFVEARKLWIVQYASRLLMAMDKLIKQWPVQERNRLGDQLWRSAESIPANIVEGQGRFHRLDKLRFFYMARGSLEETIKWIERAGDLKLIETKEKEYLLMNYFKIASALNALICHHQS